MAENSFQKEKVQTSVSQYIQALANLIGIQFWEIFNYPYTNSRSPCTGFLKIIQIPPLELRLCILYYKWGIFHMYGFSRIAFLIRASNQLYSVLTCNCRYWSWVVQ